LAWGETITTKRAASKAPAFLKRIAEFIHNSEDLQPLRSRSNPFLHSLDRTQ